MQEINYYKSNEILEHRYYQIPQELFVNPLYKDNLNSDSKLLYGFLLDRLSLSQKNKWYDKDYNVYLIFTREEVGEKLNLSPKTVTKAFKQLIDTYLIEEKRQGLGKPNLIFVGKIQHEDLPSISDTENLPFQSGNIYASEKGNNTVLDKEILPTINPNTIKPNRINTDSINPQRGEEQDYLNRIKIQCNLHEFENKEQSILEDVIDTLYYSPTLKVGAVTVNHLKILSKLNLITKDNLLQLVQIIDTNSSIKNMTQYLMICLYNNLGNSNIVLKNDTKKGSRKQSDRNYTDEFLNGLYANKPMENTLAAI